MSFNRVDANEHRKRKQKREGGIFVNFKVLELLPDDDFNIDGESFFYSLPHEDNKTIECLLNLPEPIYMDNPIEIQNIHNHQLHCPVLQQLKQASTCY